MLFVHRKGTETCSCCVLAWHVCISVCYRGLYQSFQMSFFFFYREDAIECTSCKIKPCVAIANTCISESGSSSLHAALH